MKEISFTGIIPARGGSKGIPRKNIKMIAGKPLICWTIEAARNAALLDNFFVSTDDAEIAEISRRWGAKVVDRPAALATDEASTLSVLKHVVSSIDTDAIVLLQPTSPVRDPGLVDSCIKKFLETGADNLATGFVCKFKEYGSYSQRRQDLEGFFYDDGNVYVVKPELIRRGAMFGDKVERVIIDREQNIEIDDELDFFLVEQVLLKRLREGRS